jgi:hypothetical protein
VRNRPARRHQLHLCSGSVSSARVGAAGGELIPGAQIGCACGRTPSPQPSRPVARGAGAPSGERGWRVAPGEGGVLRDAPRIDGTGTSGRKQGGESRRVAGSNRFPGGLGVFARAPCRTPDVRKGPGASIRTGALPVSCPVRRRQRSAGFNPHSAVELTAPGRRRGAAPTPARAGRGSSPAKSSPAAAPPAPAGRTAGSPNSPPRACSAPAPAR